VQGHRGAGGLRPENTLAGIACALEVGVTSIECDVVLSVDGAVVLSHDGLVPDADGSRAVAALPLTELRRFDLGQDRVRELAEPAFRAEPGLRMATLGSALALIELFGAGDVRLDVEVKSARHLEPGWDAAHVVAQVVAQMEAFGAVGGCSLRSFDLEVLVQARRQCPDLGRVLLVGALADDVPAELAIEADVPVGVVTAMAEQVDAVAIAPGTALLTPALVHAAHEDGLPVIPWTVNDATTARRLLELGVDGICTDRPDLVRAVVAGLGLPLPPRHRAPQWLGYGWAAWPDGVREADAS
jgi:glycerophosphoryl diester phosphodiesterase